MARLEVTTKTAEQVWTSPDGKLTIFKIGLEYQGKPFDAKTYSKTVATVGWRGEVESYEKQGRNGPETFVKQPQKEGGWQGGGGAKREQDPFTMFLAYAKDLAIACTVSTDKGVVFDSGSYAELLDAVSAGGLQLYTSRPGAEKEINKTVENVKAIFGDGSPVTDEPAVGEETELPL